MAKKQFAELFGKFKSGETKDAPILHKSVQVKVNSSEKLAVLTIEEVDRDEEFVEIDGMILQPWIKETGLPMVDSHNMHDSVTENGLGAFRNPRVEVINGKKALVAEPDFAPTVKGKEAEILYMGINGGKPYFTNISMGFAVYDYDNETGHIKRWEPFETSLVTVGSNRGARIIGKSAAEELDTNKLAKDLARFKQIHAPFKEFTKLFLSDAFCKSIGYEKDGNLLLDINNIFDIITLKFAPAVKQEAPVAKVVAPQQRKEPSPAEIRDAVLAAVEARLANINF